MIMLIILHDPVRGIISLPMPKKALVITLVFILLAAGGFAYVALSSNDDMLKAPSANTETSNEIPVKTAKGSYVEYASDILAKTSGQKVLFFHAAWCPQCRAIEAGIKKDGVPAGITVIKVD